MIWWEQLLPTPPVSRGFPGGTCPRRRRGFNPWVGKMATHSNILTWRIPCTKEADRLQSMGLQRVRHDWVCMSARVHTHIVPPQHTHIWVSSFIIAIKVLYAGFKKRNEASLFFAEFPEFCSNPFALVPLFKALPRWTCDRALIRAFLTHWGSDLAQLWVLASALPVGHLGLLGGADTLLPWPNQWPLSFRLLQTYPPSKEGCHLSN